MAVSPDILQALGLVTVRFQFLEKILSVNTWVLISPDQRVGQIVTHPLSFGKLCDVFSALVQHHSQDAPVVDEILDLVKRASALEGRRNGLMHSNWSDSLADGGSVRMKATMDRKKGWNIAAEELTADAITSVAEEMGMLAYALGNAIFKLMPSQPT